MGIVRSNLRQLDGFFAEQSAWIQWVLPRASGSAICRIGGAISTEFDAWSVWSRLAALARACRRFLVIKQASAYRGRELNLVLLVSLPPGRVGGAAAYHRWKDRPVSDDATLIANGIRMAGDIVGRSVNVTQSQTPLPLRSPRPAVDCCGRVGSAVCPLADHAVGLRESGGDHVATFQVARTEPAGLLCRHRQAGESHDETAGTRCHRA